MHSNESARAHEVCTIQRRRLHSQQLARQATAQRVQRARCMQYSGSAVLVPRAVKGAHWCLPHLGSAVPVTAALRWSRRRHAWRTASQSQRRVACTHPPTRGHPYTATHIWALLRLQEQPPWPLLCLISVRARSAALHGRVSCKPLHRAGPAGLLGLRLGQSCLTPPSVLLSCSCCVGWGWGCDCGYAGQLPAQLRTTQAGVGQGGVG